MLKKGYIMKTVFLLVWISMVSLGCLAQAGTEKVYLEVDGLIRSYQVYLPKAYDAKKSYPVVFILHGGGGKAKGMLNFTGRRFNELADRDGFIAVYPNGYRKGWNDGERDTLSVARRLKIDDVGFFDAMIDDLDQKLAIDRKNIFACGISNGGFMVQRLAIERSQVFKAIGVVAATMSGDQQKTDPENPVPVIFIGGDADPLVPYNGGPVVVLKQKRGEVLSNAKAIQYWKNVNGCSQKSAVYAFPDINTEDDCTAVKTVWNNPANDRLKVVDIKVVNGGHTWPGMRQYLPRSMVGNTNRDFNGCDEIWAFFESTITQ